MKTRIIYLFLFCLLSRNLFGQNDSLPNKMISFNVGTNIFYSEIGSRNIHEEYYSFIPMPGAMYEEDADISMQINVGYHADFTFRKRIIHFHWVDLYANMGIAYKQLNTFFKYYSNEYYNGYTVTGNGITVRGNGKKKWAEQYLSPLTGLSLYSGLSKKIYIETSLSLDYNFLFKGKTSDDFKGTRFESGVYPPSSPYERHTNYSYKSERIILTKVDVFYAFGVGYVHKKIRVGIQFKFLFPNIITKNSTSLAPSRGNIYDRSYYSQSIFSLQLNYDLK